MTPIDERIEEQLGALIAAPPIHWSSSAIIGGHVATNDGKLSSGTRNDPYYASTVRSSVPPSGAVITIL